MVVAAEMAERMGFPPEDRVVLVRLVELHLLLPDMATRRDLDDPATAQRVADEVVDRDTLELLAALVEADSLATGPSAWGPWKAGLVADLVERTRRLLAGEPVAPTRPRLTEDVRVIMDTVRPQGVPALAIDQPTVTVVAPDRPGLLAQVTAVLALHGLNVRSADITGEDGVAVEIFIVEPERGRWPAVARLSDDLAAVTNGKLPVEERLADRARTYRGQRMAGPPSGVHPGHRGQHRLPRGHRGRGPGRGRRRPAAPDHPGLRRPWPRRDLGQGLDVRKCGRRRLLRARVGWAQAHRPC